MIGMLILMRWFGAFPLSTNAGLCCFPGTLDPMFAVSDSWLDLERQWLWGRCCRSRGIRGWTPGTWGVHLLSGASQLIWLEKRANAVRSGLTLPLTLPHPSSRLKWSYPVNQMEVT